MPQSLQSLVWDADCTLEASRSSLPWPCSNMLGPGMREAPSTSACFMLAGFRIAHLHHKLRSPTTYQRHTSR